MKKIIYISDPEILAIPIMECHEEMVDLKNQEELKFGPPPETPLTAPHYTLMRKTIYEKLCQAQHDLPQGFRFRIYEGFRSLEVQKMLFDQEYQLVKNKAQEKSHAEIFHETTRLVSPVINLDGTKNIPPHNTGSAVDVEIIDNNGRVLEMGMEAKDWPTVNPNLCMTHCENLDTAFQKNRDILFDVMHAHDFVNYPTEWWHFSYGDRYWAFHKNKSHAIYGAVDESGK